MTNFDDPRESELQMLELERATKKENAKQKQARFWIGGRFANPVRIKINAGQTLSYSRFSRHEEGWSSEGETFSFDGEVVTSEYGTDGTDCDGRMSTAGSAHCAISDLQNGFCDEQGIKYPVWSRDDSSQRDYTAESMNY